MKLSRKIRSVIGQYRFVKEMKKIQRKPEVVNFDEAAKIGLVYDATDERDSDSVKSYVKKVRGNYKKDILAMGFVDKKSLPASQYAQYGLDFFTRKDLNFQMIPNNPVIKNFINEEFDILINLSSGKSFPIKYITAMSNAKFRVGRYNNANADCCDLLVKISGEPALKTTIDEIENLLRLMKKS